MSISYLMSAALLASQPTVAAADELTILRTHFYFDDVRDGSVRETNRVPLRPVTACYRWQIDVRPEDRTISVREVFQLPQAARQWGIQQGAQSDFTAVARDRASAVSEFEAPLGQGMIGHGWCVAPGDPTGIHTMRVYVGERLLHTFEFQVEPETN